MTIEQNEFVNEFPNVFVFTRLFNCLERGYIKKKWRRKRQNRKLDTGEPNYLFTHIKFDLFELF